MNATAAPSSDLADIIEPWGAATIALLSIQFLTLIAILMCVGIFYKLYMASMIILGAIARNTDQVNSAINRFMPGPNSATSSLNQTDASVSGCTIS